MQKDHFFRQGLRGCLPSIFSILLALCAMLVSTKYQYPEHPSCRGMLGAGFPKLFICDDWGGSSPTGSWNKIDFVDVLNGGIRPGGFIVDFLLYLSLIWFVLFLITGFFRNRFNRNNILWGFFIVMGFVLGLLGAYFLIQSSDLYIKNPYVGTPIPVVPTPTDTPTASNSSQETMITHPDLVTITPYNIDKIQQVEK
jgi:hypothetical protein